MELIYRNFDMYTLGTRSSENLSSIFNWNPGNTVGQKRKGLDQRLQKKKKALPMWTHVFICLSSKDANSPPDMHERALVCTFK